MLTIVAVPTSVRVRRHGAPCVVDVGLPRVARKCGLAQWKRVHPAPHDSASPPQRVRGALAGGVMPGAYLAGADAWYTRRPAASCTTARSHDCWVTAF